MPNEIRRAIAADALAISLVAVAVWPGDVADAVNVAHVLGAASHATHVAVYSGVVVGFVDGYPAIAGDGLCRWESTVPAAEPRFSGCAQPAVTERERLGGAVHAGYTLAGYYEWWALKLTGE